MKASEVSHNPTLINCPPSLQPYLVGLHDSKVERKIVGIQVEQPMKMFEHSSWFPRWKWLISSFFIHFQPMNQTHVQNSCHFRNRASSEGVDRDNSSNSQIKTRQNRGQLGFVTISACYKNDSSAAEMMEDLYFKYKASKKGETETCRNNSSKKDISHKQKSHPENIKKHQIFSEN